MSHWSEGPLREECGFSRTQFLRRGAAVAGGVAGLGLAGTATAGERPSADPKPIPGGFAPDFTVVPSNPMIHVAPPKIGFEMSSITDFRGALGAAEIQGTARGSDGSTYTFDADMRFMQGLYVAVDGRLRQGSFGFV